MQTTLPVPQSGQGGASPAASQVYVDSGGQSQGGAAGAAGPVYPPDPPSDLQKLTRSSTGESIPVFGRDMFQKAPSTFAPANQIPVTPDYVVGPGDQILVRMWGSEQASENDQLTVDSAGNIYIPRIGPVQLAGVRASELQSRIGGAINRVFRNYQLAVSLGALRSIQIHVFGEARRTGAFTVSSLSTALNALFVTGGPSVQGTMRHIQVRRAGAVLTELDLYDMILRGDESHDVRLQSGDTLFIPAVGPQVAVAGSVRHPAVYELKDATGNAANSLAELLELAGGFSPTANPDQVRLERIDPDLQRHAVTVALDAAGRAMPMHDGDVIYAEHISNAFEKTVTIRGNLANPGRFAWKPGMRLNDILPDRGSLLTGDYWRERNHMGVPSPLFEPSELAGPAPAQGAAIDAASERLPSGGGSTGTTRDALTSVLPPGVGIEQARKQAGVATSGVVSNAATQLDTNAAAEAGGGSRGSSASTAINNIRIPAPEIDWDYAVIERLDPVTLKSSLLPFNLGRLVQDHDPGQNLELQPGDVVTILNQRDILVPQHEQTKFVRLEGEFPGAGVYSALPDETLDQLVRRVGGFTANAYLYGSSFQRESARAFQQQRLDEYITQLQVDMDRQVAVRAASTTTGISDPNALLLERNIVEQLRQLRATGRIVMNFTPDSAGAGAVPHIPLENGDIFRVPSRPSTISVIGAVYGQNVFLYNAQQHLKSYISLAGRTKRTADKSHAFIIRADGSIYSRERAKGFLSNHFDESVINPGDAIVIPEKPIAASLTKNLLDYSQILSSFGLGVAALVLLRQQ